MSSAIPSMTCLTIINSRIVKGVSDLKACLDYFNGNKDDKVFGDDY